MPTRNFRVNTVITEEQHALLSELASLDPTVRSSAGFVRELIDQVTPLLRVTVPAMRAAAQEMDSSREELKGPLRDLLAAVQQLDLADAPAHGPPARSVSEDGRTVRRRARRPRADPSQGQ
jgi:hypothetical protein